MTAALTKHIHHSEPESWRTETKVKIIPFPRPVKKRRIGVFAGSFSPYHQGHLNITEKAARIFDEVVIVQAQSIHKPKPIHDIMDNKALVRFRRYRCRGLLTDFIQTEFADDNVTLVRGLRNNFDLQAEIALNRIYTDLMPDLNITYILCDAEYEHISSFAIRELQTYGKGGEYLVR